MQNSILRSFCTSCLCLIVLLYPFLESKSSYIGILKFNVFMFPRGTNTDNETDGNLRYTQHPKLCVNSQFLRMPTFKSAKNH